MTLRPRSLQGRLLVGVLGLVAAVWLATSAATWFDVKHELDELLDGHLAQAAALLVVQQMHEAGEADETSVDAPTLHHYAPKVAFQVWHEGRLTLRSADAPAVPMGTVERVSRSGLRTQVIDGVEWRVFAAHGGERDVQVFVGEQTASRVAILWAVLRSTLWPMALALPLLGLVGWWAVRTGLAPLRLMGRTLSARDPRALQPVELADAPSEMKPMTDALNALFERISALMESERRFTADAAHELRTPLAAIRAQAQVALAEPDAIDRAHALQATIEGCDRAVRLVEQLLTLSRLEADTAPALARFDLAAAARRVTADLAPRAIEKQQTLELRADHAVAVLADDTLLGVLVRNLVDNAVRYSPRGATIRLTATAPRHGPARLVVEDSGPGLQKHEVARLGERFFRVLGNDEPGSGLGWSIVHRIARAFGAQVGVDRSADLGGLRVTVHWSLSDRVGVAHAG